MRINVYPKIYTDGYSGAYGTRYNYFNHRGTGPVSIYSVQCIGNETKLLDCPYTTWSYTYHYYDAGVRCAGECLTQMNKCLQPLKSLQCHRELHKQGRAEINWRTDRKRRHCSALSKWGVGKSV